MKSLLKYCVFLPIFWRYHELLASGPSPSNFPPSTLSKLPLTLPLPYLCSYYCFICIQPDSTGRSHIQITLTWADWFWHLHVKQSLPVGNPGRDGRRQFVRGVEQTLAGRAVSASLGQFSGEWDSCVGTLLGGSDWGTNCIHYKGDC